MANVAHTMAEQGSNVGCMDLHFAAPDLHITFPNLGKGHASVKTINDYLDSDENIDDIQNYVINAGERIQRVREGEAIDGKLKLIAGDVTPIGNGNARESSGQILEMKEKFIEEEDLDYLLLDSAAGISNHLIPVIKSIDQLLMFHRWNSRDKIGTKQMVDWLTELPITSKIEIETVANKVPAVIDESEIESWTLQNIRNTSGFYVINENDILKNKGLITHSHPESQFAEQCKELTSAINES